MNWGISAVSIALVWYTWDRRHDELWNIPDYQTVPIMIWVLTGNFLLLLPYLGLTTTLIGIPFGSPSVFI